MDVACQLAVWGCVTAGARQGWRGQKVNKSKFGLPGGTEGVFVVV